MRALLMGLAVFGLGLASAVLFESPSAGAHVAAGSLTASVGPGFSISLSSSSVTEGDYTIDVSDKSSQHNFHLSGPGVDKSTSISGTGSTSWSVTLVPGTYHFQCDAHASSMNGDLTVTSATTSSTTTTTPSTTTTTTTTPTTTTAHTTTRATTSQETTTEAETTAASTAATTTATQPETTTERATTTGRTPPQLRAHIAGVRAAGRTVTVTVASTRSGHATAALLKGSHRLAHARGAVPGRLRLTAMHSLPAGAYRVRITVTAGGSTVSSSRALRIR